MEKASKHREAVLSTLVAQLLDDGWEPMTTDEKGNIVSMKRRITS